MENAKPGNKAANARVMKIGMWLCCAAMLVPIAGLVVASAAGGGWGQNLGAFAPVALCAGMHVAMHRFMGRSCHGARDEVAPHQEEGPAAPRASRAGAMG